MRVTEAETWKSAALGETIVGIKTVKALGLRAAAESAVGRADRGGGQVATCLRTAVELAADAGEPIERVMVLGTMMFGAYIAMNDPSGYLVGSLFAFMMLSARVAQPLVGLATLVEDYEEVGRRNRRGRIGAQPPARKRCGLGRTAAETLRRHQLSRM